MFILASDSRETYVGYTKDLEFALYMARSDGLCAAQANMGATRLVYFEQHNTIKEAIQRVEEMEAWGSKKTREFIEEANPNWIDLGIMESQVPAGGSESPVDFVKQIAQRTEKLRVEELYLGLPPIVGDDPASGGIRAKLPTGPKPPVLTGHDAKPWPTESEE